MQLPTFILATASILSVASASPSREIIPRQVPSLPCSHTTGGVHVIAVPGAGSADPPYGLIGSLARSILNAIPGSTNVSVPYNHTNPNGVEQTQQAGNTLNTYISQYHSSCPSTKLVLLGYSGGGIAMMNVLCGTSPPYNPTMGSLPRSTYAPYLIAAVAYGEETRTKNRLWDYGTCKAQGLHPRPNPEGCRPWRKQIRSYCVAEDPNCCVRTGNDPEAHYVYPQDYDQEATNYVVSQFNAYGGA